MSLTNKIIANVKKTEQSANNFINLENVICIDTSANRLGINTKSPVYDIDVSGLGTIKSYDLRILNIGYINEISSNQIIATDLSCTNVLDASLANIRKGNFTTIDVSDLTIRGSATQANIDASYIKAIDISVTTLDVSSLAIITTISAETINVSTLNVPDYNPTNANITNLTNTKFSGGEISCNTLYVNQAAFFLQEASMNKLNVVGSANFNTIDTSSISCTGLLDVSDVSVNSMNFGTISGGHIGAGEISCNTVQTESITVGEGGIQHLYFASKPSKFNNLDISNLLNTYDVTVKNKLDVSNANVGLILPINNDNTLENTTTNSNNNKKIHGNIVYDTCNNMLKLFNENNDNSTIWHNVITRNRFATFELNNAVLGNDLSYNNGKFFIDNSNALVLSTDTTYKYIPLTLKEISNRPHYGFNIEDNSKSLLVDDSANGIYNLTANVALQYINKEAGDVEPNQYTFGIYSDTSVNESYVLTKNSIMAFDNSYNFANSSLSYVGPLFPDSNGFNFYFSSSKEIRQLRIDKFSGTITRIE